jgi:hypothetical protein
MSYTPRPETKPGLRQCPVSEREVSMWEVLDRGTYIFDADRCHLTAAAPGEPAVLYWPLNEDAARALRAWVVENLTPTT